jgi:hypothetical protein
MQDAGEDGALDGKLKTAVLQELAQHLDTPSRSQSRPNNCGPPIRVQAMRPASMSDRMTARSQCRTSEAASRSSSPLASSTSLRPSARIIRWRMRPPSRSGSPVKRQRRKELRSIQPRIPMHQWRTFSDTEKIVAIFGMSLDEVLEPMSIPFAEVDLHERNLKLRVFECMVKAGLQFPRDPTFLSPHGIAPSSRFPRRTVARLIIPVPNRLARTRQFSRGAARGVEFPRTVPRTVRRVPIAVLPRGHGACGQGSWRTAARLRSRAASRSRLPSSAALMPIGRRTRISCR